MKTTTVTTYRLGYVDQTVSLCARCVGTYYYPLGPVQHGAHRGGCDSCYEREIDGLTEALGKEIADEALAQGWAEYARSTGHVRYYLTEADTAWALSTADWDLDLGVLEHYVQAALKTALEGGAA